MTRITPFALLAVLLPGLAAGGQAVHPQWSVSGNVIAGFERDGTVARLVTVDPANGAQAVLLDDGYFNANPSWSPDGSKLAYTSARPDVSGEWQLYVLDIASGISRPLTGDSARKMHPSWSPDGQWIAFVRMADGASDIYAINPHDGEERQLTSTADNEFHPKWSADGRRLLFDGGSADQRVVCVLELTSLQTRCIELISNWRVAAPVESPDGALIAFACSDESGGNICVMNSDGSGQRQAFDLPEGVSAGGPYFSPDGRQLAFHTGANGIFEIVIVACCGDLAE